MGQWGRRQKQKWEEKKTCESKKCFKCPLAHMPVEGGSCPWRNLLSDGRVPRRRHEFPEVQRRHSHARVALQAHEHGSLDLRKQHASRVKAENAGDKNVVHTCMLSWWWRWGWRWRILKSVPRSECVPRDAHLDGIHEKVQIGCHIRLMMSPAADEKTHAII